DLRFAMRTQSATLLAPGRDRGVMVHGDLFRDRVTYQYGVFEHDGPNLATPDTTRAQAGETQAGRIIGRPFGSGRSAWADVRVAVAFTSSDFPESLPAIA